MDVLNIQWVGLMPGTPRQVVRRGTISLPRIASHIGATASTTSVLTGRAENLPMITFSSPPTHLPHPESPFEDVAFLRLFLGVDQDLATAFEALFLLLSMSSPHHT